MSGVPLAKRRQQQKAAQRKRSPQNTKSAYKGVSWSWERKKWRVLFRQPNSNPPIFDNVGFFDDEQNAARAFDRRSWRFHTEHPNSPSPTLNFDPPNGYLRAVCDESLWHCGDVTLILSMNKPGVHRLNESAWGASLVKDGIYFRLGEFRKVEATDITREGSIYFPFFASEADALAAFDKETQKEAHPAETDLFGSIDGAHAIVQGPDDVLRARKGLDGKISKEEWTTFWTYFTNATEPDGLWEREDVNKDGYISWDEFSGPKSRPSDEHAEL